VTRETKIGLLTGLGVIILIGVLLSQYLGGPASSSHAANLSSLGDSYRQRQLNPVAVDPTVKPEGTMLAGVDNSAPAAGVSTPAAAGLDPAITRLPTRDSIASAGLPAPTTGVATPVVSDPVAAQPAGPIVAGPATDGPGMPPVQLGPVASNNVERAIYVPADPNNSQPPVAGPTGPTNPASDVPTGTFYTVGKGDTLTVISKHFYKSATKSDLAKIVAANPALLKNDKTMLQIGKKLLIPDAPKAVAAVPSIPQMPVPVGPVTSDTLVLRPDTGTAAGAGAASSGVVARPTAPKPATPTAAKATTYTVQSGDTLAKIAKKFMGTSSSQAIKRIAAANRLESPDDLEVGMKLKIPAKAAS
jgi:nucleoid-associated protein YgaU